MKNKLISFFLVCCMLVPLSTSFVFANDIDEKTVTRKYDANNIPVAEKYRHFRENYDK